MFPAAAIKGVCVECGGRVICFVNYGMVVYLPGSMALCSLRASQACGGAGEVACAVGRGEEDPFCAAERS